MIKKVTILILILFSIHVVNSNLFCQQATSFYVGQSIAEFYKSFQEAKGLYQERTAVKINNKWGVTKGNRYILVTEVIFDDIYPFFSDGLAPVCLNKKWGMIDLDGKFIIQSKYEELFRFSNSNSIYSCKEYTRYKLNGMYGIIGRDGTEVTQPIYELLYAPAFRGVEIAKKNGKYGLIDSIGNIIIPFIYNDYKDYTYHGYNAVGFSNDKNQWGFFNIQGKLIVPFSNAYIAYEIGPTSSADEIPPVVVINGKIQIVNNIERFPELYELHIEESTLNHPDYKNSWLKKNLPIILSKYKSKQSNNNIVATKTNLKNGKQKEPNTITQEDNTQYTQKSKNSEQLSDCDKIIDDYLVFAKKAIQYYTRIKNNSNTTNLTEYNYWTNETMKKQDNVMACVNKDVSYGIKVLTTMEELRDVVSSNKKISSTSYGSNNISNSKSSNICKYCEPENPKGWYISDFNAVNWTYHNSRYIKRPGYKTCSKCQGTGDCRVTAGTAGPRQYPMICDEDGTCKSCHGDRFVECNKCHGTGIKN
jgi:hypothetical protein